MDYFQLESIFQILKKDWKIISLGSLFSVVLASIVISGFGLPILDFPYSYAGGFAGDSFINLAAVQRYIEGGFLENSRSGYPFGSSLADLPFWDGFSALTFKFLSLFSESSAAILNTYILLSFILNFSSCFLVMRSLKISPSLASLGALLFTFLPFHFMRFHHVLYVFYFSIPLYFYIALKIYVSCDKEDWKPWLQNNKLPLIFTMTCASTGIYYAFFGIIIILSSGIAAAINKESCKSFYRSILYSLIISGTVFINILPSTINNFRYGENQEVARRTFAESENAGLKLSQLLLPSSEHRVEKLQKITAEYNSNAPLTNENAFSTLGIFGSLGFLSLIGLIFLMPTRKKIDPRLIIFSILTFTMFLTATIGGFSVLFSLFISPFIRSWNRISIFIGFSSITAMCILLDIFLKDKLSPRLLTVCCGFIAIICLLDQIPAEKFMQEPQNLIKQRFTHDKKFIESIETFVPKGSAIFQYPYITFPEGGYYEPLIGFIHSKNLHWNFGGMRGRGGDKFYRTLDKEPLDKQLEVIKKLGFQGIYIDKRFYKDGGQAMTQVFTQLLGKAPDIKSEDGQIIFFKLNGVKEVKFDNMSLSEVVKNAEGSLLIKNTAKTLFQHYTTSK